ncbi:MAG TPA: protein kinase [Fimbriiglobus sp.]|nr:protein kinase [Fimbriiglobus sp.]
MLAVRSGLAFQLDPTDSVPGLLDEAVRRAGLRHPHVVPVYDVGRHDSGVYVVSQLIDGPTLDRYASTVPRTRAGLRSLAGLVVQVADALATAHARGVLHRDVKPSNVLVGLDGCAYLTDFGLAATANNQREPAGTLAYTAPDLLAGPGRRTGGRRSTAWGCCCTRP